MFVVHNDNTEEGSIVFGSIVSIKCKVISHPGCNWTFKVGLYRPFGVLYRGSKSGWSDRRDQRILSTVGDREVVGVNDRDDYGPEFHDRSRQRVLRPDYDIGSYRPLFFP